ncbi:LAETG motif-containing sortase-dependent surface protein [Streptomyces sp. XD-27]|uniref:LAETG motif-containing sortase-dependent surface protein n=1 Tax=Streptomyces sp. XD-27 TaxID=3062779 RepID=UPI0026F46E17|nr:LAETG motif-containing sortase-dependent surface protein [Streptomyces sp. XD-27]WKX70364.1 LAETG motif-containing sortase-dependent surface protein [Streptomyces sp. XD-27]
MISAKRRGAARLAAAVLASGLAAVGAIAVAGPAAADDATPDQGGATATLTGLRVFDQAVIHDDGKDQEVGAGLFEMAVDNGGTIQTYCIDIHNPTQEKARYQEKPWDATSLHNNPDAGKIRWILQNSYPQVNDLSALAAKAGSGALTEKTAAAGTQVAIWRFSDKADVEAVDPAAEKLADYLEKSAQGLEEPKASLTLDPPAVSGKSGERLGPITVHTNAARVTVAPGAGAPAGVKVVDKDGKPVTSAANGSRLYVDIPAGAVDGSTTLTAQATTKVPVGRAFASESKSQTQILAGSSESTVSATATATWAKKGPIPALSAEKNCAKGGVDVTATNKGDEAFTFELAGKEHTVEAGKSETITVPVREDQSYRFTITGPNGFEKTFSGVLDCKTAGNGGGQDTPPNKPGPASAGGTTGGETDGGDLAETGSSSNTPMIAGIAVALVAIGGGTVFFLRKKKSGAAQ